MEHTTDFTGMLELLTCPAFCVQDGTIVRVNDLAAQYLISVGDPIAPMLVTGSQEYTNFLEGSLFLTIQTNAGVLGVSVHRMQQGDVFLVEQDENHSDLQAMALAAQELRQPLNNVMSIAERIFPVYGIDEDPALQDQVSRINRGLFQMLRIISNMSDAYRYSQSATPNLQTRDVCALIRDTFEGCQAMLPPTGVTIRYSGPDSPILCLADAEMLERAVNNIIANAVKFTPKGGHVEATLKRNGDMLSLTVRDTGTGIPTSLLGSAYFRYQRPPCIEDGRYGIGLGMVLIRTAATAHGGTVLLRQDPQQGTCLTMTIAIRQSTDNMVRSPALMVDYAGERNHRLIEFSESLPASSYRKGE